MTTHPLDRLSTTARILKRAQYEAFAFSLLADGDVLVRNESYANPSDHEYRVRVRDGLPVACPCPADERYEHACKHRVALAVRRPVLDTARAARAVTDADRAAAGLLSRRSTR
ncbi:SWIM zinc finger family protein [Halomarina salina]|uniref:SWIM zinc finger family protein n=1 Tax=Halomarina salina TaxID=1872699 RepID=A0ABD5RM06_9EURY|nr:metal-binding protein [Halomarina salina]